MLDLAESSPEEIFQLLEESPNTSEAVQEIKQLMNQQFSEGKKLIFLSLIIGGPTYAQWKLDLVEKLVTAKFSTRSKFFTKSKVSNFAFISMSFLFLLPGLH